MTTENQRSLPDRSKYYKYDVVYECCNEDHVNCFGGWWNCFQCGEEGLDD